MVDASDLRADDPVLHSAVSEKSRDDRSGFSEPTLRTNLSRYLQLGDAAGVCRGVSRARALQRQSGDRGVDRLVADAGAVAAVDRALVDGDSRRGVYGEGWTAVSHVDRCGTMRDAGGRRTGPLFLRA